SYITAFLCQSGTRGFSYEVSVFLAVFLHEKIKKIAAAAIAIKTKLTFENTIFKDIYFLFSVKY
ncbi:MAG: hypothetical protein KBD41_17475, partial [Saprospiraceae bacterium]|nr:hypothetical protein [Saprospiraceae bacterium]